MLKDLPQMLEYAGSKKQIKNIFLTTNATIFPSKELVAALQKTKATVQISDYRDIKNIKLKYEAIIALFKNKRIKYSNYHEQHPGQFYTMQDIYADNPPTDLVRNQFQNCHTFHHCNMLCDGKLLLCSPAVYIQRNMQDYSFAPNECIDIRHSNKNQLNQNILEFYSKEYFDVCKLCHFTNCKSAVRGEQI